MKNLRPLDGRVNALINVISSQSDISKTNAQGIENGKAIIDRLKQVVQIASLVLDSLDSVPNVVKGNAPAL